jgi:hypothetical protein
MANKFKGGNNAWKTMGLFADKLIQSQRTDYDLAQAMYWLDDKFIEDDPRPVFRDLYLKLKDPTGVKAAQLYLDGYPHFEYLVETAPWFKEAIQRWNREIETLFKAEAIARVRELAEGAAGEAVQLAANKYLANVDYNKDTKSKRGRPTAKEVEGELKRQARTVTQLDADFQRMKGN